MSVQTVPSEVFSDWRWRHRSTQPTEPKLGLTRRDVIMLTWAANGLTYRQVAKRAGISEAAVSRMYSRLFDRIGANNRAHAVGKALRAGAIR